MNIAETTIKNLAGKFESEKSTLDAYVALDNSDLHDDLNDSAVEVKDICDQETWVMSDGSYITRNEDEYWTGEDILSFELIEEEQEQSKKQ